MVHSDRYSWGMTNPRTTLPATWTQATEVPWVPLGPGKSFKPLRFLRDRGWVHLLRMEPGIAIARHRHTGEVHATNLEGRRQLGTGEVIGPGDYVFEPAGNVDSWGVYGDEPLLVHIVVFGAVEYLDAEDRVLSRLDWATQLDLYRRACQAKGIAVADLVG